MSKKYNPFQHHKKKEAARRKGKSNYNQLDLLSDLYNLPKKGQKIKVRLNKKLYEAIYVGEHDEKHFIARYKSSEDTFKILKTSTIWKN